MVARGIVTQENNLYEDDNNSGIILSVRQHIRKNAEIYGIILTTIAVTVSILMPIVVEIWKKEQPKLRIEVVYASSMVLDVPGRLQDIEILRSGERINAPWLVYVKISNVGSVSIDRPDIRNFPEIGSEVVRIVHAAIVRKHPINLEASIEFDPGKARILFDTLNPNDYIYAELIFDGRPQIHRSFRMKGDFDLQFSVSSASREYSRFGPGSKIYLISLTMAAVFSLYIIVIGANSAVEWISLMALQVKFNKHLRSSSSVQECYEKIFLKRGPSNDFDAISEIITYAMQIKFLTAKPRIRNAVLNREGYIDILHLKSMMNLRNIENLPFFGTKEVIKEIIRSIWVFLSGAAIWLLCGWIWVDLP